MFKINLANKFGPKFGMAGLKVRSASPEILLVTGIVTGVVSAILIARAHRKSAQVFESTAYELAEIDDYVDEANVDRLEKSEEPIDPQDVIRMKSPVYAKAIMEVVKIYGPGVLVGIASIMLVMGSHGLMKKRARALVGVIALLESGFATYRRRVVEELGEETDERFFHGAESRGVVTLERDEDGKVVKRKSTKNHLPEQADPMMYSRIFDSTNNRWSPNQDVNALYLNAMQDLMNHKLQVNGHMFLNNVYTELGYAETTYGAVVGWLLNGSGDGFVDFGLDKAINSRDGENRWLLDFNVDGVVFQSIGG